jgi:hypothetical protein
MEAMHVCLPIIFISVMLALNMIKEFVQMYQQVRTEWNKYDTCPHVQRLSYFGDVVNYAEWTLYITTGVFVLPMLIVGHLCTVQWQCGAIAVFMAWFNLLLYLQR